MPRPKPEGGGWEEHHRRLTFYCPEELYTAIEKAMAETGRSKTQVIVESLRHQLGDVDRNGAGDVKERAR